MEGATRRDDYQKSSIFRGSGCSVAFLDVKCKKVFPGLVRGEIRGSPPQPAHDPHHLQKRDSYPARQDCPVKTGTVGKYALTSDEIHGEPIRTLPNMESLQRGFEDLGLLESFVPHPEPQLDNLLNDVYSEETFQRNEESPQHGGDYGKFNSMSYGSTVGGHWAKEYAGFPKNICKGEKGRRKFLNSVGQSNYPSGSSDGWTKENHLKACDFMPLGMKPSTHQYNQEYSKGRGVHALSQSRAYSEESESKFINVPNVCFMDSSEVRHNENLHPSCFGSRWLDGELLANQKPATSPLPSSTSSSLSDGSPTHRSLSQQSYYSHASSGPASPESGQTPRTAPANKVPFSSFIEENHRPTKPFGPLSPGEDVVRPEIPVGFPGYPAQGYHRLPRKTNPQQNRNAERRGRRSGQQGNVHQNPQQFNFRRKQEPNVGNVSDFINTSFLPPFALMSDNKQSQNFPPFNPQAYTPPTNLPFPPPTLPFSDLFDLLHYEDLNRLNPFLSDLLCSELPPPPPYISFPTPFSKCRPQRNRSGPASELHVHLEECSEQLRALEKERKTTEAELGRHFPGNRASGSYSSAIPRLPTNPSRVDRLIVDEFREHARAVSLVKIMERICSCALHVNITLALEHHLEAIRLTQSRRKDEIVNAANRQKQGAPRYNNERDVLALAAAIKDMAASTRRARTALWCAVQMTLPKSSSGSAVTQEDLERALQELFPTKAGTCADIKDGKRGSE
ncbi:meiosis-specific coiled-coil domain-containing protein MEIOC-like [Spea bombifrons]|uniref:meiosis-specific coiled-coil domain-containing protein MEIOC-like n=1 Tax=Spea bombifrons TaxID=233779 RepID=UPI002349038D|nr:meiosis-specific coiled-coil domain-containing protein MEIOC-like [Spea bombifrons]